MPSSNLKKLVAEFVGTTALLATVVGSGIMGENLCGGNLGLALLVNSLATGSILYVLITMFGSTSGAHFNPAVTLAFLMCKAISPKNTVGYIMVQLLGSVVGVWLAHAMFGTDIMQVSAQVRTGGAQWLSEAVATGGLVCTILVTVRVRIDAVALSVGLYITAAYWFTASTSFANPAVSIARSLTDTFSGIRPEDVVPFVLSQLIATLLTVWFYQWFVGHKQESETP